MLVDSSVWINAQDTNKRECLTLKRLIQANERLSVCAVIVTEVCQGARSEKEFLRLQEAFLGFEWLNESNEVWSESAWNYFRARRNGLTLGTIDCFIATLAKRHRQTLWSADKIFVPLQKIVGFDLYRP